MPSNAQPKRNPTQLTEQLGHRQSRVLRFSPALTRRDTAGRCGTSRKDSRGNTSSLRRGLQR